jgi:hypothetical protein
MMSCPRLVKLAAVLLALSALAATFTILPPKAKAADTPNTWFESIPGQPAGVSGSTFYDVQWTPDGQIALWVGRSVSLGRAVAYSYQVSTNMWTELGCFDNLPGTYPVGIESLAFNTAAYIPGGPYGTCFLVMGDTGVNGAFYLWEVGSVSLYEFHDATTANFVAEGSVYNPTEVQPYVEVVGSIAGSGAFSYRYSVGSEDFAGAFCYDVTNTNNVWYDVELDTSVTPADLYYVGMSGTGAGMYYVWDSSMALINALAMPSYIRLECIEFDPYTNQMVVAGYSTNAAYTPMYRITKGAQYYSNWWWIQESLSPSAMIHDLDFDSTGKGVAVGNWTGGSNLGLIVDIWWSGSEYKAVQRSDSSAVFVNAYLHGVAIAPTGGRMAFISGSAFKYYYTAASSNVQVDTMFPHVDYIELYDMGMSTSKLNTQIDVDPGDYSTWYDFEVRAWHNSGQTYIQQVDVYAWYDGGAVETEPTPFDGVADTGNLRMHFRWTRGTPDTWAKIFPGVTDETVLWDASCTHVDEPDLRNVTLRFRFSPGPQVRAAAGPFTEPSFPGNQRYDPGANGPNPGDQSTINALNNLNSWNVHVVVADTGTGVGNAYDEFGFFRYTYIGTSGLPGGGAIRGAGAPNTQASLSPVNDVTYYANCPYQLVTSVTDLIGQNLGQPISATAISILGGQISSQTYFTGAGVPLYLYGSSPATYVASRGSLRWTTTSMAVVGIGGPMWWYCDIPGVPEDYYKGTITYSIWHG